MNDAVPMESQELTMMYRNYRGEQSRRRIKPVRVWYGTTDWHPVPGFLLTAWDYEKNAERDFALADCVFDERFVTVLEGWAALANNATVETGVCCCGDYMESHPDPMNCGHAPCDHGGYVAMNLYRETMNLLGEAHEVPPPLLA